MHEKNYFYSDFQIYSEMFNSGNNEILYFVSASLIQYLP